MHSKNILAIIILAATIVVPVIINTNKDLNAAGIFANMSQSAALFGAGVGTIVYLLFTKRRSPVFLGSSFTFLGAYSASIAQNYGYWGMIIGVAFAGLVYVVIAIIVAGVIGVNKEAIISSSLVIIAVIVLQYFIAMALGFIIAYISGMKRKQMVTIAIELAFQNSGLSTSLAKTHFPALTLATVPGALYSVWQNFAGSILAYVFTKYYNDEE